MIGFKSHLHMCFPFLCSLFLNAMSVYSGFLTEKEDLHGFGGRQGSHRGI